MKYFWDLNNEMFLGPNQMMKYFWDLNDERFCCASVNPYYLIPPARCIRWGYISEISIYCMQQTLHIYPKGRLRPKFSSSLMYYLVKVRIVCQIYRTVPLSESLVKNFQIILHHVQLWQKRKSAFVQPTVLNNTGPRSLDVTNVQSKKREKTQRL